MLPQLMLHISTPHHALLSVCLSLSLSYHCLVMPPPLPPHAPLPREGAPTFDHLHLILPLTSRNKKCGDFRKVILVSDGRVVGW